MPKSGIYETTYGNAPQGRSNACTYEAGEDTAYDMDAAETIPLEMVDFDKFLRRYD